MITIIGAHGTGKTTLIKKVINEVKLDQDAKLYYTNELPRLCPFEVGVNSNYQAQEWIYNTQRYIESLLHKTCIPTLLDRCCIDHYAYYIYWVGRNTHYEKTLIHFVRNYQKIYFFPPNKNYLVEDGLRPLNVEFQQIINNIIEFIFENILNEYKERLVRTEPNESIKENIVKLLTTDQGLHSRTRVPVAPKYDYDDKFFDNVIGRINVKKIER